MLRTWSESPRDLHRDADRRDQLRHLQRVFPVNPATESLVRDENHIAGLKSGIGCASAEHSARAAYYRTISSNHADRLLVCHGRGSPGLVQVPTRALAGLEGD